MTPVQLKREVEKFRREYGDDDIIAVLDQILERWLDEQLSKEVKIHKSYLAEENTDWTKVEELEIDINKKRIEKMRYFWENSCREIYPKFEERLNEKINEDKKKKNQKSWKEFKRKER